MPTGSAGRRYAQAVFSIAKDSKQLDQWANDLQAINLVLTDPAAARYLDNPKINREQKLSYVRNVLNGQVSPAALNLAALLVQRGRQHDIEAVVDEYKRLINRERGIETATIITAVPIDDAEEAQIKARLTQLTGKQMEITRKVDPDIIGGVVARVGDTLIDGSVKSRLDALRKALA